MMLDKFFIAVEITGKVLDKWLEGKGGGPQGWPSQVFPSYHNYPSLLE